MLRKFVDKAIDLLLVELRHRYGFLIRRGSRPGHTGRYCPALDVDAPHRPVAGITRTPGQPVAVVYMSQRVEPLLAPPCRSEFLGHGISYKSSVLIKESLMRQIPLRDFFGVLTERNLTAQTIHLDNAVEMG